MEKKTKTTVSYYIQVHIFIKTFLGNVCASDLIIALDGIFELFVQTVPGLNADLKNDQTNE